MRRGQKTSAEQVVLTLRQIEVQTAQGKRLSLACKDWVQLIWPRGAEGPAEAPAA